MLVESYELLLRPFSPGETLLWSCKALEDHNRGYSTYYFYQDSACSQDSKPSSSSFQLPSAPSDYLPSLALPLPLPCPYRYAFEQSLSHIHTRPRCLINTIRHQR